MVAVVVTEACARDLVAVAWLLEPDAVGVVCAAAVAGGRLDPVAVGRLDPVAVALPLAVVVAATLVGVPRDAVAEQVVTDSPSVKEARPSAARGSAGPAGRVPT